MFLTLGLNTWTKALTRVVMCLQVEYLGVMAWAAQFQWIDDRPAPGDRLEITCPAGIK